MNCLEPVPQVSVLPVPVPLPVRYTNCYAVDTGNGWVLIDTGMDTREARSTWETFIERKGLRAGTVQLIYVTHAHPDHLGLAYWLADRLQAPVAMTRGDADAAKRYMAPVNRRRQDERQDFYRSHGLPSGIFAAWQELDRAFRSTLTLPTAFETVHDQETRHYGTVELIFMEQGGHTDHQGLIYLPQQNALLTGDQVLARITPNVSLWPGGDPNPLASYIQSLNRLMELDHPLGLPAHEDLIDDVNLRIGQLLEHHEQRNGRLVELLREGPATAFRLTAKLFTRPLNEYQLRFAMGETLAHLEYLHSEGRIHRSVQDGIILYYRS